ncbi:MAG: hypothetical protein WBN22_07225 [Verrucomicrobiia bacterium]
MVSAPGRFPERFAQQALGHNSKACIGRIFLDHPPSSNFGTAGQPAVIQLGLKKRGPIETIVEGFVKIAFGTGNASTRKKLRLQRTIVRTMLWQS